MRDVFARLGRQADALDDALVLGLQFGEFRRGGNAGDDGIPGNVLAADGSLASYDVVAQCHSVFANVRAVLEASGARWDDLVDVTVYLTDMANDFRAYNVVWAEYFPDAARAPCRTTLGITALPTPIAIELKCLAILPAVAGAAPT